MDDAPTRDASAHSAPASKRSANNPSFTRRALIAGGVALALVLAVLLLRQVATVLLLLFGAVLLSVFLDGLTGLLRRYASLPHGGALAVVVLLLIVLLAGFGLLAGPRLAAEVRQLSEQIPQIVDQLRQQVTQYAWVQAVLSNLPQPAEMASSGGGSIASRLAGFFSTAFSGLTNTLIVFIVGLYLAVNPKLYVQGALHLVPKARRARVREVLRTLGTSLRWWLVGRFASMAVVGIFTTIGLFIAGVPLAFVLGVIAAVFSFVPYIGPIASAVPALLVGLAEGPTKALYVIIIYVLVQLLESYAITPLIQERAVSIPPALLIAAQVVLGVLAGVLGVLLATPLAVVLIALVQMLYVEDVLGDEVPVLGSQSD